jgi:cell division protein FtsB
MIVLVLVVLLVALLIPLTAVILDSQVGRAIAARLEGDREIGTGYAARLGTLEGEVDRLSKELQRLDEQNAFLQQLLEERKPEGLLRPGDTEG